MISEPKQTQHTHTCLQQTLLTNSVAPLEDDDDDAKHQPTNKQPSQRTMNGTHRHHPHPYPSVFVRIQRIIVFERE